MNTVRIKKSYDFLWLGIALFFVLTLSFLLSLMPTDYWWNLRVGQETLQAGRLPTVDTYSTSRAGQPVVYSDWLAGVFFWGIYKVGGVPLTIFLRGLLIAATFGLLWAAMRRLSGPKLATLLTIFVLLASSRNWPPVRPQIFAFPLFILTILILQDWHKGGEEKYLVVARHRPFLGQLARLIHSNLCPGVFCPPVRQGQPQAPGTGSRAFHTCGHGQSRRSRHLGHPHGCWQHPHCQRGVVASFQ